MLSFSSTLITNRKNSICFTEHPPGYFALNVALGPIRMIVPNSGGRQFPRSLIGICRHCDSFRWRLVSQHDGEGVIDDLDIARIDLLRHRVNF
jgi:hypothetical protein